MTDLEKLPGAPPPGDPGWKPAGGPVGAVPDAVPFVARPMDMSKLSPLQRHEWAAVLRDGSREAYEAFVNGLGNPNSGPASPPPDEAPNAAAPEPVDPELAELAAKLSEHGSDIGAIEALGPQMSAFNDRLEGLDEHQRHAMLVQGDEQVLARIYRGNEGAMNAGLADIKRAAKLVGLDTVEIDETGVLADPELHRRLLLLARSVLSGRRS
jgi:hypothetical protein